MIVKDCSINLAFNLSIILSLTLHISVEDSRHAMFHCFGEVWESLIMGFRAISWYMCAPLNNIFISLKKRGVSCPTELLNLLEGHINYECWGSGST